ncbi:DUF1697 domain-containing protein [Brucepastera parasyntrophica]|uniref:DUF1697 domain-containing protein n=1 Tax=Brucepastera parasyntrophica TaxID=2880008 RepID=UPI00210865A2|nr:DUF1697 domain-containing protein [Brucepastera parasyntrophica]ULQ58635.1 DUF1697 domain-containing protein [Brucepastera parasyntrophica]
METYVYAALLRGINAGGNNIIKMVELKRIFEEMDFSNIKTYIQTGNVIFNDIEADKTKITDKIETAISKKLNNTVTALVLSKPEIAAVIHDKPAGFGDDKDNYKYDIIFLMKQLGIKEARAAFDPREGVDQIYEGGNVLYISRAKKHLTKSRLSKIVGSEIYPKITIRNWVTTEKIYELIQKNIL